MALPTPQEILDFIAQQGARQDARQGPEQGPEQGTQQRSRRGNRRDSQKGGQRGGQHKGDITRREIARAFGIKGPARTELRALLTQMETDGLLAFHRKKRMRLPGKLPPVTVIDILDPDADGDLICAPANWHEDGPAPAIVLPSHRAQKTLPPLGKGDRFLGKLLEGTDGSYEATPIKALSRDARRVLGVFEPRRSGGIVRPVSRKAKGPLMVDAADCASAVKGDIVWAELIPSKAYRRNMAKGRIREIIGRKGDSSTYTVVSVAEHAVPYEFPENVLNDTQKIKPYSHSDTARAGQHQDWRDIPFITIDPEDARDHDDAIFAQECADGWRVLVAIADVAWYVRPGSPLDQEAQRRGNSTYFPGEVVPMLPERLSTDLCSLKPGESRPALAAEMIFAPDGTKLSHQFARIIMRSAAALSYEEAQQAAEGAPSAANAQPVTEEVIKPLWAAFAALRSARADRAPLELTVPERRIELDTDGDVRAITQKTSLEAHRLVEEMMIQANICAAETLKAAGMPLIYRVHDAPDPEKLEDVRTHLDSLGYTLAKGQVLKPALFNHILRKAQAREDAEMISQILLRAQSRAVYDTDNLGHFGLNLRNYAHFTSPIRRYADLTVHRALLEAVRRDTPEAANSAPARQDNAPAGQDRESLQAIAEAITLSERRSMQAERDCVDRYVAGFLEGRIGAAFPARISGVTGFGLFVALDDTGADGFIPIKSVGDDYFIFEAAHHRLRGERTGGMYYLGQSVEVRLAEATPLQGGLRFDMLSPPAPPRNGGRSSPVKKARKAPHRTDAKRPRNGRKTGSRRRPGPNG